MVRYVHKTIFVGDLKLTHPLFEILNISFRERYAIEAKYFNYYGRPVVTEDLIVLTNVEDVKVAIANGIEKIQVVVVSGFDMDDAPRFITHGISTKKLSLEQKVGLVKYWRNYLQNNPKGMELAETLDGDINDKIGALIGNDKETVKLWVRLHGQTLQNLKELANPKPESKPESETVTKKEGQTDNGDDGKDGQEVESGKKEDEPSNEEPEPDGDIIEKLKLKHLSVHLTEKDDGTDDEVPEIFCKGTKLKLTYERHEGADGTDILTYKNREGKNVIKLSINLLRLEEDYNISHYEEEHFEELKQERDEFKKRIRDIFRNKNNRHRGRL